MSTTEPTIKIELGMSVGYIANSTREETFDTEIPVSEWEAMTEEEREERLQTELDVFVGNNLDAWANVVEEDE